MSKTVSPKYAPLLKSFNENTDWFDENFLNIITKIKYTPFALTIDEWNDIYLQAKDDEKVLEFLISRKECPYSIIKKMIDAPTTNHFANKLLTLDCLREEDIKKLLTRQGAPHIASVLKKSMLDGISPYSQNVIEYMINTNQTYDYAELVYTTNSEHIRKLILENSENEKMMQMIANNINISEKIRNKAYEYCDWNNVYSKTEDMNKLLYQSITQTLFELKPETDTAGTQQIVYEKLLQMICKKELPESCQIDLINRSKELHPTQRVDLLLNIVENTDSRLILSMIWDVNIYRLRSAVSENPNATDEQKITMLKEFINSYNPDDPYSTTQLSFKINDIIDTTTLTDDIYSALLDKKFNYHTLDYIISSEFTPMKILKDLSKGKVNTIKQEQAKIYFHCRENGIKDFAYSIKSVIDIFRLKVISPIDGKILRKEMLKQKYFQYAIYFADINIKNKQELDYVLSVVDKIKSESKDDSFIAGLDFYKKCIKEYYNKKILIKNADKIFKEVDIGNSGQKRYNLMDYEGLRNAKTSILKTQVQTLDTTTLEKIINLIEQECKGYSKSFTYSETPKDIVKAHLAIEGYADLYNIVNEEIEERVINIKEKEENIDGYEK